jgi:hypothetical protein
MCAYAADTVYRKLKQSERGVSLGSLKDKSCPGAADSLIHSASNIKIYTLRKSYGDTHRVSVCQRDNVGKAWM